MIVENPFAKPFCFKSKAVKRGAVNYAFRLKAVKSHCEFQVCLLYGK